MGGQKLLLRFGNSTLLARAFEATRDFPTVAVVSPALVQHVQARRTLTVVVNEHPERGMSHSLKLADAAIEDRDASLIVVLADTPLVEAALVKQIAEATKDADVAFPVRDGVGGHPIFFGSKARAAIGSLADGDSLRRLRDDPRWRRVEVPLDDEAPFLDVDTPDDLARARQALASRLEPPRAEAKS